MGGIRARRGLKALYRECVVETSSIENVILHPTPYTLDLWDRDQPCYIIASASSDLSRCHNLEKFPQ